MLLLDLGGRVLREHVALGGVVDRHRAREIHVQNATRARESLTNEWMKSDETPCH